jgi:hypothetical protein
LPGCGPSNTVILQLPLANHVHEFNAGKDDARTAESLESHHRSDDAFDSAVILLDDVVQILALADLDRCRPLGVKRFERSQIDAALVHGDRFGLAVLADRLLEVATRSHLVTMGTQQEIDGVALLVDGAVQVFPLALDPEWSKRQGVRPRGPRLRMMR